MTNEVVVIGAGPGGLGFAHEWSRLHGGHGVTVLEAGPELSERFCWLDLGKGCRRTISCDVLRGIGGASALAGGKISDFPAGSGLQEQMGDERTAERYLRSALLDISRHVDLTPPRHLARSIEEYSARMNAEGIAFKYYPAHKYKQNSLLNAWQTIVNDCRLSGVDIRSRTLASFARTENGSWTIDTNDPRCGTIYAKRLVLATGRSASPLIESLECLGFLSPNQPQIGLRLEFPSASWTTMDECHNDLKLKWGNARTYCASKEGRIAPYWLDGVLLAEGSCDAGNQTESSNIAVLVDATAKERAETIARAREYAGGRLLRQTLMSYLERSPRCASGDAGHTWWKSGDVSRLFGPELGARIQKAVEHFATRVMPAEAQARSYVYGPELNGVAMRAQISGATEDGARIWSIGEVTGLYRGILQSFAAGKWLAQQDLDVTESLP